MRPIVVATNCCCDQLTTTNCRSTNCRRPISWAPRSPDLAPLDFFFYEGTFKQKYTKQKVNNIADLKERIEQEIKAITKRNIGKCF